MRNKAYLKPGNIWALTKESASAWSDDNCSRLAAALAYYTMFSLAPLLIISIAVAGVVFGEEAARGQIVGEIQHLVGKEGGEFIQTMIQNASKPGRGVMATVIGVLTLIVGATGVFVELQQALNSIWKVAPKAGSNVKQLVRARAWSLALILGIGFLLLVSLVLSAAIAGLQNYLSGIFPAAGTLIATANFVLSFGITAALFSMIYKFLPDAEVGWRDVILGAALSSLLFSIGRLLIGLYLGRASVGSAFGAAGSLAVILVWVYYSAQIFFFGAEFTKVFAKRYGSRIRPSPGAVRIIPEHPAA